MGRPRKLTPEQEREVYRKLQTHYDNQPRVLAAVFGISIHTVRSTYHRQKRLEARHT